MRPILFLLTAFFAPAVSAAPVLLGGSDFTGALQPQADIGAKGEVHLVFGRKDGSLFHSVSPDGVTYRTPVKIGTLPKLALGMHRGPRVVVAEDKIIVSAISHESGDLVCWTSSDGRVWQGPVVLNSVPKAAREGLHAMAASGAKVAVSWLDDRSGGKELRGTVSKNAGRTWEPDAIIYKSPEGHICSCCAPSLAFGPKGNLAAMWRNDLGGSRDLYLALSDDGGRSFGSAKKLGTGTWKFNACPMDGGGVTFLPSEPAGPVTLWRRENAVYLARPDQPEARLGEGKDPAIAGLERGEIAVWQSSSGLKVLLPGEKPRLLDAQGRSACLAAAPDGHFAVAVWESGDAEGGLKAESLR